MAWTDIARRDHRRLTRRYPSDLQDREWSLIAGLLDDTTLSATGMRVDVLRATFNTEEGGDFLESSVELSLGYDLSIDSSEVQK